MTQNVNDLIAAHLATARLIEVLHVNRDDSLADRFVNEYGSKRPAESRVVGRLMVAPGENANRKARTTFPAPEGWFTTYRIIDADALNRENEVR